ncbi:hypothetical protein Taro_051047 [Colocasia esculenta]|uniref:Uncharacterized protein n=1 Tax=Colocasia esculenta TaxID=4460 RepID=A0A843XFL6_COLES|nr:hypothetical protein [Colocasia esculenta]
MAADYRNIVNVTVEFSSFGRPKKEKLEPHLRPLREATAPTQPSQPGSQPSQPTIHRRQRETSDVREHPEDIHRRQRGLGREAKRIVYSVFLCVYTDCGLVSLARLRPVRGRRTRIKYVIGLTGLAEAFRHTTPLPRMVHVKEILVIAVVEVVFGLLWEILRGNIVLGSWEAVLGHQEQRRTAGEWDFFPNRALL